MTNEKLIEIIKFTKNILKDSDDPQHTFAHINSVRLNALKIVELVKIKNIDLNLLQAACCLHDVPVNMFNRGPLMSHIFENYAIHKFLPDILKNLEIEDPEYQILYNSINRHNFSFPYKRLNMKGDNYTKVLEDADTIDMFSDVRIMGMVKNKNRFLVFRLGALISDYFVNFGRKNIKNYLNFPELSKYDWYRKGEEYKDTLNKSKTGLGKTVLILHGFPGLSQSDPIRKYVKSRNYNVVIPDLFSESFIFNPENLRNYIKDSLNGSYPDLIIAASLGGLVAPSVAMEYPRSKLILIATGPRVSTRIPVYNFLAKGRSPIMLKVLYKLVKSLPLWFTGLFYRAYNRHTEGTLRDLYEENLVLTINVVRRFSYTKILELTDFVKDLDNSDLLKKINNPTLIISGNGDVMMPPELSKELNTLVKKSILLENKNRLHFNCFDERDFEVIDKFVDTD